MANRAERERRRRALYAVVALAKVTRGCADSGVAGLNCRAAKLPPYCLDFDHLPQYRKDAGIAQLVRNGVAPERLRAELAKVQVVCCVHHRIRTYARRHGP